jgi:hypothetical protein
VLAEYGRCPYRRIAALPQITAGASARTGIGASEGMGEA